MLYHLLCILEFEKINYLTLTLVPTSKTVEKTPHFGPWNWPSGSIYSPFTKLTNKFLFTGQ